MPAKGKKPHGWSACRRQLHPEPTTRGAGTAEDSSDPVIARCFEMKAPRARKVHRVCKRDLEASMISPTPRQNKSSIERRTGTDAGASGRDSFGQGATARS
jgi:hypothetical protein